MRAFVEREGIGSFVHVPIALGPRLFGVLTASHEQPGYSAPSELARLEALAPPAAGAIANALDFQRERRIAAALTRGFIPGGASDVPGFELGLVYEPAGHDVGGGDIFGVWTLPSGALAVLVGDVSGKGLEVAALSAMVRFFVEARTWDSERPGEVLAQTDRAAARPAAERRASSRRSWASSPTARCAGPTPATARRWLLRADGDEALKATGVPLGVEATARATTSARRPSAPATCCSPPPTGSSRRAATASFFGEQRLPAVLAEHGRTLAPRELVALVYREVEAWAPQLDDDVVILALRPQP